MILQALNEYYERKSSVENARIPPPGFEWKAIDYILVVKSDGTLINIYTTLEGEGRSRRAKEYLVPQSVKKTVAIASNLLWENPEYVLEITTKGKVERIQEQHRAFIERIEELKEIDDEGIQAIRAFLKKKSQELSKFPEKLKELSENARYISFQLSGDTGLVIERPAVRKALERLAKESKDNDDDICLVTGRRGKIERLHPAIKGVWGAQTTGANIVSFNLKAFESYGKTQGANAPVSTEATFSYTTALNHLLRKDSEQVLHVGDTTIVFWSKRASNLESQIPDFFGDIHNDDPDRRVHAVASLYQSIETGAIFIDEEKTNHFYVLGLAPNASRVSVRFWIVDTVTSMAQKIYQHFKDFEIIHSSKDNPAISLHHLLRSLAVQGKPENIPPKLAGEIVRAALEERVYPFSALQAAIRRIRAEHVVPHPRAALIKACINRKSRYENLKSKEDLAMSLDENNSNIGYRLGRLFAVLERIQQAANPGINATIRDKFYSAASGTPVTVFGNLMRLKNHHLAKLENVGLKTYYEKAITNIMGGIDAEGGFPAHLSLEDQGRFAVGYYHQMQDFFTKKANKPGGDEDE